MDKCEECENLIDTSHPDYDEYNLADLCTKCRWNLNKHDETNGCISGLYSNPYRNRGGNVVRVYGHLLSTYPR